MANKASRTIQEQIELLENRGMMFRDKAFAMECLKRISYFRLKAYWWDMQSDPINHVFTNGSCFEDVIERSPNRNPNFSQFSQQPLYKEILQFLTKLQKIVRICVICGFFRNFAPK